MWASRRPSDGTGAGVRAVLPGVQVSWKVAEVAECDARGDHERAVRLLADWTQQGDVDAMTELGKRLLVGYRAPFEPRRSRGGGATRGPRCDRHAHSAELADGPSRYCFLGRARLAESTRATTRF